MHIFKRFYGKAEHERFKQGWNSIQVNFFLIYGIGCGSMNGNAGPAVGSPNMAVNIRIS